jgi:hypothetical protein
VARSLLLYIRGLSNKPKPHAVRYWHESFFEPVVLNRGVFPGKDAMTA